MSLAWASVNSSVRRRARKPESSTTIKVASGITESATRKLTWSESRPTSGGPTKKVSRSIQFTMLSPEPGGRPGRWWAV